MPIIELKNVTKKINHRLILDNISLTIDQHHIYGISGPNGSGKTILLKTILGFVKPNTGNITVQGHKIRKDQMFASNVGFSFGEEGLLPMFDSQTNLQLLLKHHQLNQSKVISTALSKVGLDPYDHRKVQAFSLGMKQRLSIACALVNDDPIIILDEPTNGLDKKGQLFLVDLIQQLKKEQKTVLLTSHDEFFLKRSSDHIFQINDGKIRIETAQGG